MKRRKSFFGMCAAFSIGLTLVVSAVASAEMIAKTEKPMSNLGSMKEMIDQSELVFSGKVEKIEYALSEPAGSNGVPLPHTFVTYRVDEVFSGEKTGELVTLRFFGGLDEESGDYISTDQAPHFDIGDQDILFVRGNTEKMCPLVGNQRGRFRAINKQVYSETGISVVLKKDGSMNYGPRYRLDEVETNSVKDRSFKTKMRLEKMQNLPSEAVDEGEFKALIKKSAQNFKPKQVFVSADPTSPFTGPNLEPSLPPANDVDTQNEY